MASCTLVPVIKGKESKLFREILTNGFSRNVAQAIYDHIHSEEFRDRFGDWINNPDSIRDKLDENGEPRLEIISSIFSKQVDRIAQRESNQPSFDKLSEYFGDQTELTIDNLLQGIEKNSLGDDITYLVSKLKESSLLLPGIKVIIDDSTDKYATYTTGKKQLTISRQINKLNDEDFQRALLHEIVHAFTADVLVTDDGKLSDKQLAFKQNMIGLFNIAKHSGRGSGFDAQYKNVVEFVAEGVTNKDFQAHLKSLNRGNIWERFITLIKRLFGVKQTDTLIDEVLSYIADIPGDILPKAPIVKFHTPKFDQATFNRRQKLAVDALKIVLRKISDLSRTSTDGSYISLKRLRDKKKALLKDIEDKQFHLAIVNYTQFAMSQINDLKNAITREIKDDTLTLARLNQIYTLAKGHDLIRDIYTEITTSPDFKKEFTPESLLAISESVVNLDQIELEYTIRSKEFLIEEYSGYDRRAEAALRLRAERTFKKEHLPRYRNNKATRAEINKAQKEFIDGVVANADLNQEKKNRLRTVFDRAIQDIGQLEMWMTATQNMSDDVLQITKLFIDKAQDRIRRTYIEYEDRLVRELDALKEFKGNVNPDELYNSFIERDKLGSKTQHIVSYVHSSYYTAYEKAREEAAELDSPKARREFINNWLFENADIARGWTQRVAKMKKEKKKITKEKGANAGKAYEDRWFELHSGEKWVPKAKWRNPQFDKFNPQNKEKYLGDNHPEVRFYRFIIESMQKQDAGRPLTRRLGFRLPGIRKTVSERLFSSGGFSFQEVGSVIRETVKIDSNDTEFGEFDNKVFEDVDGEVKKGVPLFFTAKIEESDQSYDIASLLAMNAHNSINYREMTKILPQIDATKHLLSKRPVIQRNAAGEALFIADTGEEYTKEGKNNNIYKAFENMIDAHVYGIRQIPDQKVLGAGAKFWNSVINYTSLTMLAGNWVAGFANVTVGNVLTWIESIGGKHFSKSDLGEAYKQYLADTAGILGDVGADRFRSKTNLLSERFDAMNDFIGARFRYADNNRAKRAFNKGSLYFINRIGEHWLQHSLMYAVLNQVKVVNENGEYLNTSGEVVNKPVSILEFYENQEGKLVLPDFVKKVEREGKLQDWNHDTEFEITQKIRHINELLHGAYGYQNRPELGRHILGRMVLSMRKWIEPGFRKRWRGFNFRDIFIDGKPQMIFSQQLGEFEQGQYVTTLTFISNSIKQLIGIKTVTLPLWSEMTDIERANVMKTVSELGFAILAFGMGKVLEALARDAGDDDENELFFLAYQANRLYTDLFFYSNPIEFMRLMSDPTPTAGIITDIGRFGANLLPWNWGEVYERGRRKGQYKIQKDAEKLFPIYRHIDRLFNMEEAIDFFNQPI